jgi:hypothetical protein
MVYREVRYATQSLIGSHLTPDCQELPALLGKSTIVHNMAVTENGHRHRHKYPQYLSTQRHQAESDSNSIRGHSGKLRGLGGRKLRFVPSCFPGLRGICRRPRYRDPEFTVKEGGDFLAAHTTFPPVKSIFTVWGRSEEEGKLFLFFSLQNPPPQFFLVSFLSFPRMRAARLSGDQGGRVPNSHRQAMERCG